MMTTREYNEARRQWKVLEAERLKLEREEDVEHEGRLVEIQDTQHKLMTALNTYREAKRNSP